MEENEENILKKPYFNIEYLDDNNIKHLGKVQDEKDVKYMKERFTLLESEKIG